MRLLRGLLIGRQQASSHYDLADLAQTVFRAWLDDKNHQSSFECLYISFGLSVALVELLSPVASATITRPPAKIQDVDRGLQSNKSSC